ncbi:MAG: alpha/beta fold hydrolase [bacterium]
MQAKINGIELAFDLQGSGVPVLLLHAFPLNRSMWQAQANALSRQFRVITPDFRGFGDSERSDEPYTMELLADDICALLKHLSVDQIILGGLSMGGYVAFAFYLKYPEMVQRLILADTRAEADTEDGKANRRAVAELARKRGAAVIAELMTPKLLGATTRQEKPEVVKRVKEMIAACAPTAIANAQIGMSLRPDSTSTLKAITCPTLILVGEEDLLTTVEMAKNMHSKIKDSVLQVVPKAGHLSNLEQPESFNAHLVDFLQDQPV